MDASVLIPTRGRSAKLCRCLEGLARQVGLDAEGEAMTFEVIVAFDGPDPVGRSAAEQAWRNASGADAAELRVIELDHRGYTIARNELVSRARGRVMVSINDDVVPQGGFVATHVREQRLARERGLPAIVVGHSPFVTPEQQRASGGSRGRDTLLNRLVRESSMVFFYDAMTTQEVMRQPQRDWGFRHCFGLNFSAELAMVREVGMFTALEHVYGYDDIELGFRLARRFAMPVLFRPSALAPHEHTYVPGDLLRREEALGEAAWWFARTSPEFGRAVFGRDVTSEEEVAYSREFVERERASAERLRAGFETLGELPADAIDGEHAGALRDLLVQQHLLLKRWHWRAGLLRSAARSAQGDQPTQMLGPEPSRGLPGVR